MVIVNLFAEETTQNLQKNVFKVQNFKLDTPGHV